MKIIYGEEDVIIEGKDFDEDEELDEDGVPWL